MSDECVIFEVIAGREGACLAVGIGEDADYRLAGPKPWGGGKVVHKWTVPLDELLRLLDLLERWEMANELDPSVHEETVEQTRALLRGRLGKGTPSEQ